MTLRLHALPDFAACIFTVGGPALVGYIGVAPFYAIGEAISKATKPDSKKADSTDGVSKQDETGPECVPEK